MTSSSPFIAYANHELQAQSVAKTSRKPAIFPSTEPGETKEDYILTIKDDFPKESVDLLGITFLKGALPTAHSLAENAGKPFAMRKLAFALTQKQVDALKARAKEVEIRIPSRRDPDFVPGKDDAEKENLPGFTVMAEEVIQIIPLKDYNPISQTWMPPTEDEKEPEQTFKETLYTEQRKRGKKEE